jgi:hypothetical protein
MDPLLGAPEGFDATLMRANDLAFSFTEYIFLNRDYTLSDELATAPDPYGQRAIARSGLAPARYDLRAGYGLCAIITAS